MVKKKIETKIYENGYQSTGQSRVVEEMNGSVNEMLNKG